MEEIILKIPIINNQLEQYKSSIDVLIKQNNDYLNTIKRYSNKNFEIEINENERNISEEKKNEIETMMDQLEDIQKRNESIIQNIDDYSIKMNEMKKNVDKMKEEFVKK